MPICFQIAAGGKPATARQHGARDCHMSPAEAGKRTAQVEAWQDPTRLVLDFPYGTVEFR